MFPVHVESYSSCLNSQIPDCGQSPHVEKFEQFLEIVAPFLESETGKMEDSFGD